MLWGVPEAQQQPFSSMAMVAQVWQSFGKTEQEGVQAADESAGIPSGRRSAEVVSGSADRGQGGNDCQSVSAPALHGGAQELFQVAALADVA